MYGPPSASTGSSTRPYARFRAGAAPDLLDADDCRSRFEPTTTSVGGGAASGFSREAGSRAPRLGEANRFRSSEAKPVRQSAGIGREGAECSMDLYPGARMWLPCEVKPGPFSDERMVLVVADGSEWFGFSLRGANSAEKRSTSRSRELNASICRLMAAKARESKKTEALRVDSGVALTMVLVKSGRRVRPGVPWRARQGSWWSRCASLSRSATGRRG